MANVAFSANDYRTVVRKLDEVVDFMKANYVSSEEQAWLWMRDFIQEHYFPVYRAMNTDEQSDKAT